jgi:hypothetical protein
MAFESKPRGSFASWDYSHVFKIFTKHIKFTTNNNLMVHSCGFQPFEVGGPLLRLQKFCEPLYINQLYF